MGSARSKRKLKAKSVLIIVTCLALLSGCYYDSLEALHPLNGYVNPCDSTQHAVYSEAIQSIISYNCLSCHNASYSAGNVSLDSYDQVKKYGQNGQLMNAVLRKPGTVAMPPTAELATCQTEKLQLWINNNYPL